MVSRSISKFILWAALALLPLSAAAAAPVILVMGDSLSAGYGLATGAGWVNLLQQRLQQSAYPHRVINASVSGETSSGGLTRLPALLAAHKPDIVLIELGANDGLRGLPIKPLQQNLDAMVALAKKAGARPLLFEMRIPPNYGVVYTSAFQKAFATAATRGKIGLVPFFLNAVAQRPELFQADGIHPTAAAQALMLDAVWPSLGRVIN